MVKKTFLFLLVLFIVFTTKSYAASSYVLPYPSTMPGSIFYKIHIMEEAILKYWYFGDFGQFNYSLKLSDKYLVEAKTLFEYNQYLLGFNALQKSDNYFKKTLPYLSKPKSNGKDISEFRQLLSQAALKHKETLQNMGQNIPPVFTWSPEKSLPTVLNLKSAIENSIKIREKYL